MAKVIGLVNLHTDINFKGLSERRPVASVSFLGRYAVIDFVLSNMSNSNIDNVGVLIKEKPRSLFKHMGLGNSWNMNSKSGGISLLYNECHENNTHYNHDINNIAENIAFLQKSKADYVVIAPAHIITTINYQNVIEEHAKSGAEITMVYKHITDTNESFIGQRYLDIKSKKVVGVKENKGNRKERNISLDTYVINLKTLLKLITKAKSISAFFNLSETLAYLCDEREIMAYEYKGYARCLNSMEAYYRYSLEFLNLDVFSQVFKSNWPIYTNTNDTPPSKYKKSASVKKSFVSNGAIIDGTVEDSIIGRNVEIGKGAVVKGCILLAGCKVSAGSHLENIILDKGARVVKHKELLADNESPLYVKQGDVI